MHRSIWIGVLGVALLGFGCSQQDRAERHEKAAREDMEKAHKDIREGHVKAREDMEKARNEERTANEDRLRTGEQQEQPVAGHDMSSSGVEVNVRDQLGSDWTVERRGMAYLATRKAMSKADAKMDEKVNDQMKSLRDDYKDASAAYRHGEVVLRGHFDDCADAGKAAEKFAKIDGVNKILIDVTCTSKEIKQTK